MAIFIYVLGDLFSSIDTLVIGILSCAIWEFTKHLLVKKFPFLTNYLKSSSKIELEK